MRTIRVLPLMILAACGGGDAKPDARIIRDDVAPIDTPPPPPGCDYAELQDGLNDWAAGNPPEATLLKFGGTAKMVVCGKINEDHYLPTPMERVDIDSFTFEVTADSNIKMTMTVGSGAAALDEVDMALYDIGGDSYVIGATQPTIVFDHGWGAAHVPPGTYELDVAAHHSAAITAAIDYKLTIEVDPDAATRCPKSTAATASFTEAGDTAANTGNDVLAIDFNSTGDTITLTPGNDVPENTNLTIGAMSYRVHGNFGINNNPADSYMDRDTYKIKTGATTNRISFRLNWAGTSDLDMILLDENLTELPRMLYFAWQEKSGEDEFATFAVKPNTNYWVWLGHFDEMTAPTVAQQYDLTVCGESATVPMP